MIKDLPNLAVPGIIAVSFFLFGFFTTADLLGLSLREIMVGLMAGTVGGVTTLAAVLHQWHTDPTFGASAQQ